jgi:hypothetical protein
MRSKRTISLIVILSVVVTVLFCARLMVILSLSEKHSNIKYVVYAIDKIQNSKSKVQAINSKENNYSALKTVGTVEVLQPDNSNNTLNNCTKNQYKGNSIVDYLYLNKEDYSFIHRKNLAAEFGINNYSGTAEQNIFLLLKLKEKEVKNYSC